MTLAISLTEDQAREINRFAADLGVAPEELARAAVVDLITQMQPDFESAADGVIKKNRELYERLA